MNPLAFLGAMNPKAILATVVLVATLAASFWYGHIRYQAGFADATSTDAKKFNEAQAQWLDEKAKAVTVAVQAIQVRLDEAQRRITAQEGVIDDTKKQVASALASLATARQSAGSLRDTITQLVTSASASGSAGCSNPTAAGGSTAAQDAALLAQVLREADQFAGEVAEDADAANIAGSACQRAYQALIPDAAVSAASAP